MNSRYFAASLLVLLVGCGPTYTAGTKGMAAKDLAVLSITQLPAEAHVEIHSIQFDNAPDQYPIGKSHDFYLLPGEHTASFTFHAVVPGPAGWLVPGGSLTVPGPEHIPLGSFAAGKSYELAPTDQAFEKLLQDGRLSLVREKAK